MTESSTNRTGQQSRALQRGALPDSNVKNIGNYDVWTPEEAASVGIELDLNGILQLLAGIVSETVTDATNSMKNIVSN